MSEKWWDMSDDELDDLFRDASDKVDIPFESPSFAKLRQKIDIQRKPEPPQGYKSRLLALFVCLFLIVGVSLVYQLNDRKQSLLIHSKGNNSTKIAGNIEQRNIIQPSNTSLIDSSETSSKAEKHKESNSLKLASLSKNSADLSEQKQKFITRSNQPLIEPPTIAEKFNSTQPSVSTKTKGVKIVDSLQSSARNLETDNRIRTESKAKRFKQERVTKAKESFLETNLFSKKTSETNSAIINGSCRKTSKPIYKDSKIQLVIEKNSKNNKVKKGKYNVSNALILAQNTSPIIENSAIIPEKISSEEIVVRTNFYGISELKNRGAKSFLSEISTDFFPYTDSLPTVIKSKRIPRFGIRLALSPDINSIEAMDYSKVGGSIAMLFEYRIGKKFALQTGVSYSSKKYVGDFEYYHAWPDWTQGHPSKPIAVNGKCQVIDIPINLRFDIFQKPRQNWFVSAGASSYIMLNETYIYTYTWAPTKTMDWVDKSSFYWSTLNISIGWEKQVSKHLNFQVEPYLKTPLKGVGRGLMNLYSSGLLFSTKYCF